LKPETLLTTAEMNSSPAQANRILNSTLYKKYLMSVNFQSVSDNNSTTNPSTPTKLPEAAAFTS